MTTIKHNPNGSIDRNSIKPEVIARAATTRADYTQSAALAAVRRQTKIGECVTVGPRIWMRVDARREGCQWLAVE